MFGWLRPPAIAASRRKLSVVVSQIRVVVADREIDGLQREDAIDQRIAAEIDVAHRAAADRLEQLIAADRRRHLRALVVVRRRVVRAHEPVRDVAKLAVDLRDAVKQIGGFVGRAMRRERAGKVVDLGKQTPGSAVVAGTTPTLL